MTETKLSSTYPGPSGHRDSSQCKFLEPQSEGPREAFCSCMHVYKSRACLQVSTSVLKCLLGTFRCVPLTLNRILSFFLLPFWDNF